MPAYWLKPEDHVDPEWFMPLEKLSALVAERPDLPQINPDHFLYCARIVRTGFPVLHAYRHLGNRRFLNIDESGALWRYTGSDRVGCDRYKPEGPLTEVLAGVDLRRGNLLMRHVRPPAGESPSPAEPLSSLESTPVPDAAALAGAEVEADIDDAVALSDVEIDEVDAAYEDERAVEPISA